MNNVGTRDNLNLVGRLYINPSQIQSESNSIRAFVVRSLNAST